jgi:hypothetical protein
MSREIFLFMDLSCASFSICFIFASQAGFPSAQEWSCAIWWSHFIRASALDFCVVHSSCCSLVTSFHISFVGRARIRIGLKLIFSERFRIDVVIGACQFLQSRMFLWISSCCPFVVSYCGRSYPNFLFAIAAGWAPASSKKLLYICWYTLTLSWVGPCFEKDLVSFIVLWFYISHVWLMVPAHLGSFALYLIVQVQNLGFLL